MVMKCITFPHRPKNLFGILPPGQFYHCHGVTQQKKMWNDDGRVRERGLVWVELELKKLFCCPQTKNHLSIRTFPFPLMWCDGWRNGGYENENNIVREEFMMIVMMMWSFSYPKEFYIFCNCNCVSQFGYYFYFLKEKTPFAVFS